MAQQTINVGTSPNDGTGTPLRTAFQYTNSNFSELYTAVGPSGNNIVVPGSATITGDLTVDTSTLKVDSTNNRVGIGTASPGALIEAYTNTNGQNRIFINNPSTGSSAYNSIDFTGGTAGNQILSMGSGYSGSFPYTTGALVLRSGQVNGMVLSTGGSAAPIVFGINDSEAMRLNSTGLGVGVAPGDKIHAYGSGNVYVQCQSGAASNVGFRLRNTTRDWYLITDSTGAFSVYDNTGSATRFLVDTSGNVGVGVTPSAWATSTTIWRALDMQYSCGLASTGAGSGEIDFLWNAYYDQTDQRWEFKYTGDRASRYSIGGAGVHTWYNTASTGTANGAITWTPAMTLTAGGELLVGKTAAGFGTVGNEVKGNGEVFSTQSSSSNAATTYHVYSTAASAYRFYVGLGGTVYATNTTISAISDARFKENVEDIDVGLGAILALKPRKFDWKAGKGKDIKGDRGFIAQEFEQVFPNLIDEWKDNAPEGEAPYKSVRQDLIPVLVKAIQELTARVQTLEAK